MKTKIRLAAGLLILSTMGPVQAQLVPQGGMTLTSAFRGIFHPTVGSGAEYEATGINGAKSIIDMAVVGKKSVQHRDAYWVEISANRPALGDTVLDVLITGDEPNLYTSEMSMAAGGRGAVAVPVDKNNSQHAPEPSDIRAIADDLGNESVTVQAGTFSCEHFRAKDGTDAWIADAVAPFGLVKVVGKDDNFVLVKMLTKVKDKL